MLVISSRLFAALIGMAFLIASTMIGAEGSAKATLSLGHSQGAMSGDCPQQPPGHHKASPAACCVSGCITPVLTPRSLAEIRAADAAQPLATAPQAFDGLLPEVETPPPRSA